MKKAGAPKAALVYIARQLSKARFKHVASYMRNPRRIHHTAKWRRMVRALKRKGGAYSPYAVATARMGPSRLNPFSSKTKRRAARVASKLAYRIWQHIKTKGYALPVPKRTPKLVKKYTQKILAANGIKWTLK